MDTVTLHFRRAGLGAEEQGADMVPPGDAGRATEQDAA
eukprot:gene153-4241_t